MSHACPAPDCEIKTVRSEYFACRRDWYRLPNVLRRQIWDTAGEPWSDERSDAVANCVEYWRTHPLRTP